MAKKQPLLSKEQILDPNISLEEAIAHIEVWPEELLQNPVIPLFNLLYPIINEINTVIAIKKLVEDYAALEHTSVFAQRSCVDTNKRIGAFSWPYFRVWSYKYKAPKNVFNLYEKEYFNNQTHMGKTIRVKKGTFRCGIDPRYLKHFKLTIEQLKCLRYWHPY